MVNVLLVALQRLSNWTLHTPFQAAKDLPDVARMVVDATLLLDQLGDPRQGPQARFVTESFWASFQSLLDLDQFRRCQSSLSTAPTRCFQAPGPVTLQSSGPPTDRLP